MKKLKIASFFAGVGGIDLGFKELGNTIYANEIDKYATKTFENNFNIKVDVRDICTVKSSEIPDFDIMIAGFPCQAFSIAGYRQGFEDEKGRGNLFFELERIFKAKQPKIIFLENVKNLVSHDKGRTFTRIIKSLEEEKYHIKYNILNTMNYGNTPQNRERIYIVAFKSKEEFKNFEFPKPLELTMNLSEIINFSSKEESKYYYSSENFTQYNLLKESIKRKDTIYQWRRQYVRENKSNVCPTLTANMGTGGHNVPLILADNGIRKLTPRECFNLQGFPQEFILPEKVSNTQLYKQAGNSVSVSVIRRIAKNIKEALCN